MVEATVNPKYQRIKEYLMNTSKDSNMSEEFVDRFVYNYMNKDKWIQSDVLFNWFGNLHNTQYKNFVKEITKQLTIDSEYRVLQKVAGLKTIYLVSQSGIKQMAMLGDKQVRKYYAQLEVLMFDYIDQREDELQQTIDQKTKETEELKTYIEENKEEYVIYEHEVIGENRRYRGITNDIQTRNSSHRRNSCNPHLRRAFEESKQIKTTIIQRFRSLSRNEQKCIERRAILEIPISERMNIKIPKAQIADNTSSTSMRQQPRRRKPLKVDQNVQISQSESDIDLSTVQEVQSEFPIKKLDIRPFQEKLMDLKRLYEQKGELHMKHMSPGMYQFYRKMAAQYYENKLEDQHRQMLIESNIPLEIMKTVDEIWMDKFNEAKKYYECKGVFPKEKGGVNDLGKWFNRQFTECWNKLDEQKRKLLVELCPNKRKNISGVEYQQLFKDFITINKRLPKCSKTDKTELMVYKWMTRTREVAKSLAIGILN